MIKTFKERKEMGGDWGDTWKHSRYVKYYRIWLLVKQVTAIFKGSRSLVQFKMPDNIVQFI